MKKRSRRPTIEQLEDRCVPATWGLAWPNAGHLTLSFAPDGTNIDGYQSNLFQQLNAQYSTQTWQAEILRAFQTWANYLNVNVGVVPDDGEAFGTAAPVQGAYSFGDIRIGAHHLGASIGLSTPYDPLAASRSGDVVLDTAQGLGIGGQGNYDLFTLALHEAGHVLGLGDTSTDATSIMYTTYTGAHPGASSADIATLQNLYGPRVPDAAVNATFLTAPTISQPDVPGSLASIGNADLYRYVLPTSSNTSATITVQTGGISLLTPQVTMYDSLGNTLGTAASTSPFDGGASLTVTNLVPGATYYFKVQGARTDVYGVGSYRLKIDSGAASEQQIQSLEAIYNNTNLMSQIQAGSGNTTLQTAVSLNQSTFQQDPAYALAATNSITSASTQQFYQVTVPANSSGQAVNLVASVLPLSGSTLQAQVAVFDALGNAVAADLLVNQGGQYVVQIRNAMPQTTYYLEVSGNTASTTGSYLLGVDFRATTLAVNPVLSDTLGNLGNQDSSTATAQGAQVTHFTLSASTSRNTATVGARLLLYQNNQVVFVLTALAGQTVSGDVFLASGSYRMTVTAATSDGSALPPVSFKVSCDTLTGPLDPVPLSPSSPPPPDQGVISSQPTQVVSTDTLSNPFVPPPTLVPAT